MKFLSKYEVSITILSDTVTICMQHCESSWPENCDLINNFSGGGARNSCTVRLRFAIAVGNDIS